MHVTLWFTLIFVLMALPLDAEEEADQSLDESLGESLDQTLDSLRVGDRPPPLVARTIDGELFSAREFAGEKVLVINFFATLCIPCVKELPDLQRFYATYQDSGVTMCLVAVGRDRLGALRAFRKEHGLTMPIVRDRYGKIAERFKLDMGGRDTVPLTFILDTQGVVRYIQKEYKKGIYDILVRETASLRIPQTYR